MQDPMAQVARLVTAEELERFPSDDRRYELVAGRLIRMSPVGFLHGRTVAAVIVTLSQHVRKRRLGVVVTEVGFKLASNPDTVRAPDVAFLRQERIPSQDPRGFWKGAPDLAIEVLSRDDRPGEIRNKVAEYFDCGVAAVVVLDPDAGSLTVHRPGQPPTLLGSSDELDLGDVVEGFRASVRELFD